jgi:hypothetical protein
MNGNQPINNTTTNDDDYYVVPVIEGPCIHNDTGFCYDMAHECHENPESIAELHQGIQDGELTVEDANNIYRGKTV